MNKVIILVLFLTLSAFAQEKYLIYFKDKGESSKEILSKSASKEMIAKEVLSEKSIERRKKNLGDNYLTYQDLPVNEIYINTLTDFGIKIENKLKWLNLVSAILTKGQLDKIRPLEFISKI